MRACMCIYVAVLITVYVMCIYVHAYISHTFDARVV